MEKTVQRPGAGRQPKPETITALKHDVSRMKKEVAALKGQFNQFRRDVSEALGYRPDHFGAADE
jgi:hypothetical protein